MALLALKNKKTFFVFSFLFLILDQLIKLLLLSISSQSILINRGAVFGLEFSVPNWLFLIVLAIVIIWAFYSKPTIAWAMILGGGLSNVIDRYFRGGVVDFKLKYLPAFNLADLLIILGVILVVLSLIKAQANSPKR